MDSKSLIQIVTDDGWYFKNKRGSHSHYIHPFKKGKETIPHPKKDIPVGTVNNILKQAGLK